MSPFELFAPSPWAIVNKKQCETRGLFMSLVIHYWIDVQDSQGVFIFQTQTITSKGTIEPYCAESAVKHQSINQSINPPLSAFVRIRSRRTSFMDDPIWFSKQKRLESSAEGRQRRCRRNLQWQAVLHLRVSIQQPKMLGCQQWNGEPEAGRGSRCRKREVLGDLEGRQRRRTGQVTTVHSRERPCIHYDRRCY